VEHEAAFISALMILLLKIIENGRTAGVADATSGRRCRWNQQTIATAVLKDKDHIILLVLSMPQRNFFATYLARFRRLTSQPLQK
jgi:hypothetical protein